MAYIKQVPIGEATGATDRIYKAALQRSGKVANIVQVMGREGGIAESSMRFYVSLMKSPNRLMPARREMLAAVVSNANDCFY